MIYFTRGMISMQKQYWLFKSEPQTFSIQDLMAAPHQKTLWEGVRNFQANRMMLTMQVGDLGFFYHSSCKTPGIVGVVRVCRAAIPDPSAMDPSSPYFDQRSSQAQPRFWCVQVELESIFPKIIALSELRANPHLQGMRLLARGSRLSITPVTSQEWLMIDKMA